MSDLVICEICGSTFTTSSSSDACSHCKTSSSKSSSKNSYSLNKAKEARKTASSNGLKALTGSDKQKSWGESIRKDFLASVSQEAIYLLASSYFAKASFWIDNRNNLKQLSDLLAALAKAKSDGKNELFVELRAFLDDEKVASYVSKVAVKKTKKSVMQRAWVIAKEAAKKFGGSSKLYFAQSLKMAWSE